MENTIKMFKSIDNLDLYKYTIEELDTQYKLNHNPQILANVFMRTVNLIKDCAIKFFTLQQDDVSSISVCTLDYCLLNFSNTTSSKFTAYFYSVLYKQFSTEVKSRNYQKRKANYVTEYFDFEHFYTQILNSINSDEFNLEDDTELVKLTIEDSDLLTKQEKLCCLYILEDYNNSLSKTDLATMLHITRPTLYSIINSLKTKLNIIFA